MKCKEPNHSREAGIAPCTVPQGVVLLELNEMHQRECLSWGRERRMLKVKNREFPKYFHITFCITGAAFHIPIAMVLYKQLLGWKQSLEAPEYSSAPDQSYRHELMKEAPVSAVSVAFILLSD